MSDLEEPAREIAQPAEYDNIIIIYARSRTEPFFILMNMKYADTVGLAYKHSNIRHKQKQNVQGEKGVVVGGGGKV